MLSMSVEDLRAQHSETCNSKALHSARYAWMVLMISCRNFHYFLGTETKAQETSKGAATNCYRAALLRFAIAADFICRLTQTFLAAAAGSPSWGRFVCATMGTKYALPATPPLPPWRSAFPFADVWASIPVGSLLVGESLRII